MSNSKNGSIVRELEEQFAHFIGAKYAVAVCNATAGLHTALVAVGVKPGEKVSVPALTMAATTLAVLHAGGIPEFMDVHPGTWIGLGGSADYWMPVSLYGLQQPYQDFVRGPRVIDDAAEGLNKHAGAAFSVISFQASKLLSAGEGGMLVTDDEGLARSAMGFSRLGYAPYGIIAHLKDPRAVRHHHIGYNYRMADCQAALLLSQLDRADEILAARRYSADCYRQAISGCDWLTPQYVPDGWPHSWWTYAVALKDKAQWEPFAQAIVQAGGERPYAAWRLTYQEPAFRHLAPDGTCPVAEDLQPRLMQLATNHTQARAEGAADALYEAIGEIGG